MRVRYLVLPVLFFVSFFTLLTVGYGYTQLHSSEIKDLKRKAVNVAVEPSQVRTQVLGKTQKKMWFSTLNSNSDNQFIYSFSAPIKPILFLSYQGITDEVTISFYPVTTAELAKVLATQNDNERTQIIASFFSRPAEKIQHILPWGERVSLSLPETTEGIYLITAKSPEATAVGFLIIS